VASVPPNSVILASPWRRLIGALIDSAVLGALTIWLRGGVATFAIRLAVSLAYFAALNGFVGRTVGKLVVRTRVVDVDTGDVIGVPRSLGRIVLMEAAAVALAIPFLIDSVWIVRDPRRQALHDKAVRSIVVLDRN
jgi:uncharacterized RDD family membrane protein YckC